jgi:hypothetical protein
VGASSEERGEATIRLPREEDGSFVQFADRNGVTSCDHRAWQNVPYVNINDAWSRAAGRDGACSAVDGEHRDSGDEQDECRRAQERSRA